MTNTNPNTNPDTTSAPVLDVTGLKAGYGSVQILHGIDLYVDRGEFVTIIGPNGCGKSTFLKALFGLATLYDGKVMHDDTDVSGWRTDRLVARGIAYVPQVDNVFPSLTVRENMQMGGIRLSSGKLTVGIDRVCWTFPDLEPRISDLAATLSGGERQMLAISRALISNPSFLLLDEPTAALSPKYQQQIMGCIDSLREEGMTVLLVEQNARLSLARSDRGYIFSGGKVVHTGSAADILDDPKIGEYFLGVHQ
jgi:ABC-type branched-subunit amino acid transport system ATPase component